jgi:hypothetical protein
MRQWLTMIDQAVARRPVRGPRRPDRRRRWWLSLFLVAAVAWSGFLMGRGLESMTPVSAPVPPATASPSPEPVVEVTRVPTTPASPAATPTITTLSSGLLQLPGQVPTHGSGKFSYATTRGPVLGAKGPLRRFKVAVERGSGESAPDFAAEVERILGDRRSWTGGGSLRLQRVPGADRADFTVLLATRDTAGEMCARGGTNIRVAGKPYTSCRTTGKAIINLDRWRLSAKPYLTARMPLTAYRQYLINHEVGHELGHWHVGCPRAGSPAPVMVQQTLTTRGCVPYAWPRRGDRFLHGPAL